MAEASGSAGVGDSATPTHSADGSHGCLDGGGPIPSLTCHTLERRGVFRTIPGIGRDFMQRLTSIKFDSESKI